MKKTIFLGIAASIAFVWAGCNGKDETKPQTPGPTFVKEALNSPTAMALRANDWKIISFKEDGEEIIELQLDSCEMDDLTRFNEDGTYSIIGNTIKCDSLEPGIQVEGTWQTFLKDQEKYLLFDGDNHFRIVQVDQNTLKLKKNFDGIYTEIELEAY